MNRLSEKEILELIDSIAASSIEFDRVKPHDMGEIRKQVLMGKAELKLMVSMAIKEEHLPGGDIELPIPSLNKTLVGHHDGIFWLE